MEHITAADIKRLDALIAEMESSAKHKDVRRHLEKNFEFHELIISLSGNQKLLAVYRQLRTPIHIAAVHYRSSYWLDRVDQEQREHRAIVRALEQQDPEAVSRAIKNHLKGARSGTSSAA
ncbi:MAG: FCD domain-containing protein [Acidobacteria bacterium]|nr:FCD domain-containing protein [Acidobacteriota bacterium]MCI0723661.1 FCD domain-containing protein [Acidobacteriota bacterium]